MPLNRQAICQNQCVNADRNAPSMNCRLCFQSRPGPLYCRHHRKNRKTLNSWRTQSQPYNSCTSPPSSGIPSADHSSWRITCTRRVWLSRRCRRSMARVAFNQPQSSWLSSFSSANYLVRIGNVPYTSVSQCY
jgi:hypothetical protein